MHEILEKITVLSPELPRAEKRIADALLENPEAIENMTLAEISRASGASEASIIRFCRRMGYDGYTSLKNDFIQVNHQDPASLITIGKNESMSTILEKLYHNNLEVLSEMMNEKRNDYEKALDLLLKAKAIHFFAVGDACMVASLTSFKFNRIGVLSSAQSDVMCQMVTASNMTKHDVAIAVSYEGRSRNVVQAMQVAKQRGASTISITRRSRSPLMDYTDVCLLVSGSDLTAGHYKISRRIADQFILEALYLGYESRISRNFRGQLRQTQEAIDLNKI